ncbi:phosphoglycerate dehydrogenase [Microbacterium sp. SYP-A9085]|uniref:phosphoglycerate dehydrogenase n=1 Tax=Microbacterium sp. SYP-A9085 TaxID=2664454 RepID=UPI00129B0318|nr:phosphoglycerate dehydrogenase [Microbacterium sp. SYP-A9085]MRH27904.1 phosphoglycerate dehydrogenase [Microbacterium sp. SYP-A9085]
MRSNRRRVTVTTGYLHAGGAAERLLLDAGFDVQYSSEVLRRGTRTPLREQVRRSDALILGTEPLTAADLTSVEGLQIVARTGAGYDNVDLAAASAQGIVVCNTPGANEQSVVELTLGLLLSLARDLPANITATARAEWNQGSGVELAGATLGVVGVGKIGRSVARSAAALGMSVIGYDPWVSAQVMADAGVRSVTLDNLLAQSDFVSLHLALTDDTRNLIGHDALRRMKKSAFLVNTSRGGVVNEHDLVRALDSGQIAGAALDVIECEPIAPSDPLLRAPNLLLTAHIAGATAQARRRMETCAAQQVIDFFAGRAPVNRVNG